MSKLIVGIDIGGTNTDAVLVKPNGETVSSVKRLTTDLVYQGFEDVLLALIAKSGVNKNNINTIVIGTTHCTNALLQADQLFKVGLIRIAGHKPVTLPPCFNWYNKLKKTIQSGFITINGGHECDGKVLSKFCIHEAKEAVLKLAEQGAEALACVGVFSPLYPEHELLMESVIKSELGNSFPYTLSYKVGGINILERENATILNSALIKTLRVGFKELEEVLKKLEINAELFFSQNNGTLITAKEALEFPIKTLSSGQTNSFIGAAKLANVENAIIIDIGGTTSDCGIIVNGFPRRSFGISTIADIQLNFTMPDVISIALGGGSTIKNNAMNFEITSKSVQRKLFKKALSFGGDTLTLTDIAIHANMLYHPLAKRIKKMPIDNHAVLKEVAKKIENLATKISYNADLPIVIVGGGSVLIESSFFNREVIIPYGKEVANAYGAALAEYSITEDIIIDLKEKDKALDSIKQHHVNELEKKGINKKSIRIIEQTIIPFHYLPNNIARVIITSAGKIR